MNTYNEKKVIFMLGDRVMAEYQHVKANIRTDETCTVCNKGVMYKTFEVSGLKWCDTCHVGQIGEMRKP